MVDLPVVQSAFSVGFRDVEVVSGDVSDEHSLFVDVVHCETGMLILVSSCRRQCQIYPDGSSVNKVTINVAHGSCQKEFLGMGVTVEGKAD